MAKVEEVHLASDMLKGGQMNALISRLKNDINFAESDHLDTVCFSRHPVSSSGNFSRTSFCEAITSFKASLSNMYRYVHS